MSERPYFHLAYIVKDLQEAIPRFEQALGVKFLEPIVAKASLFERGKGERPLELKLTYSMHSEGPWIELMEAQGDGIYSLDNREEGMHHIGVWESDCEARVDEMKDKGFDLLAAQYTPEGKIIVAYFAPEDLHGGILELVDESRREMMVQWFSGGPFID